MLSHQLHYAKIKTLKNRRPVIIAVLLMLSIGNYYRIHSDCDVRPVQFISILAIGILLGALITEVAKKIRGGGAS